jgi:hypothetical protein
MAMQASDLPEKKLRNISPARPKTKTSTKCKSYKPVISCIEYGVYLFRFHICYRKIRIQQKQHTD